MPVQTDAGAVLQAFIALLAIANPMAAVPVFLSLVPAGDRDAQRHAARRVAMAVLSILAGAVIGGRFVLELFGISFAAFRAGGGLVVTLTGLDMLRSRPGVSTDDTMTGQPADQLIVPVAMPLIAGPGTIITAMTLTARARSGGKPLLILGAVVSVAAIVWLVLSLAGGLQERIGTRGQAIVSRFMGLVLVAIGAQLMLGGIAEFFDLAPSSGHR